VDSVPASWTAASGRSMVDSDDITDGKPLVSQWDGTPACRCSLAAVGKGKGCVGDSPQGSPELRERPGD
jgi:hypothetical protein